MQQQKRVRSDETQGSEPGRELTEDELAAISGGGNPGVPGNLGLENLANLVGLGNSIAPLSGHLNITPTKHAATHAPASTGTSPTTGIPGLGGLGLGTLSNLAGGLLGGVL